MRSARTERRSAMLKRYLNLTGGQLHLRDTAASGPGDAPTLLCLHPLPYSGLFFDTVTPFLADGRRVLSPDYPGYGGSARGPAGCSIEHWAGTLDEALSCLDLPGPVDVLGFHTGCLVASELALQAPQKVRRLVLVDVPYFDATQRQRLLESHARAPTIDKDLHSIAAPWESTVASKLGAVGADRALAMLAEQLRTGTRVNEGFAAAFAYDCEAQMRQLSHPCLVLGTASSLLEASRRASGDIAGARFLACESVHPPAFESGAETLAKVILEGLAE